MAPQDLAINMLIAAKRHEDRYLLPRRYRMSNPNAEVDALYDAAQWLVNNGYARWVSASSSLHPGIILTGREPPPSPDNLRFVDDVKPEVDIQSRR